MANLSPLRYKNRLYYALIAAGGLVMLMGLYASHMMEVHGHIITGMNNQIVWGMPHVFAIFMIVAASGVLNIASIGSVFGKSAYKGRAPLAGCWRGGCSCSCWTWAVPTVLSSLRPISI
jgi:Ni/Fe-hydrogenase subunit HybB-like protein